MTQERTNRLVHETSPYLRQHAYNPVDWYAWGPEALERARQLDRPVFLSIGYSACHWCHVMEHESFEDPEVARILNDNFISIKVDREERPDLDQIYMTAVQLLTGQGGWPMSLFLSPDLKPFFGGTYFPPDDRYGRPSFRRLLLALADAWKTRRGEIATSSQQLTEQLQQVTKMQTPANGELEAGLLQHAVRTLERTVDRTYGGFGSAPKFPHPMELRLLLRVWQRFSDANALDMASLTLDHMARGGIYDHLGGGFHRYSTDERWLVPHFEKMLYDNALLSTAYLEAFQATGSISYRLVVEETLAYVQREMTSPQGYFFSTQDADSEGEEGKFYVWSLAEVEKVLGPERAEVFTYVYDVSAGGNWEGKSILHRPKSEEQDSRLLKIPEEQLHSTLEKCKQELLAARGQRIWPARDEKALTSWNALMIGAFAQAASALQNRAYATIAERSADFLLRTMRGSDGRLLRTYSAGSEAKLNGYLEDYAFLIDALVDLYEATFQTRWISSAVELANLMLAEFWDDENGGLYFTGKSHEALIVRSKDVHDSSIPSGNSVAALALFRLARLTGRTDFHQRAETIIRLYQGLMVNAPSAAGQMLIALDYFLGPVQEFAIVGDRSKEATNRVLQLIQGPFRPRKVVALDANEAKAATVVTLLAGKKSLGNVTTYICENFACQAPLVGAEEVERSLGGTHSAP